MCDRRQYTQAWLTLRRFFLPFSPCSVASEALRLGDPVSLCVGDSLVVYVVSRPGFSSCTGEVMLLDCPLNASVAGVAQRLVCIQP